MRLIDANALGAKIYTEAFIDGWKTQIKRWNGDCWIKYNLVEKCLSQAPTYEVPTIAPVKIDAYGPHTWACGYCLNPVGTKLFKHSYCSHCGRKVKWNNADHADDLISRLSELRSQYNCFSENERPAYDTLSEAIKVLQEQKEGKVE